MDDELDAVGEDDDPGDDHQMQVAVGVGRRQHGVIVLAQARLRSLVEAVEVRPPHPDRGQQAETRPEDQLGRQAASAVPTPTPIAMIDSPRQMITNEP